MSRQAPPDNELPEDNTADLRRKIRLRGTRCQEEELHRPISQVMIQNVVITTMTGRRAIKPGLLDLQIGGRMNGIAIRGAQVRGAALEDSGRGKKLRRRAP